MVNLSSPFLLTPIKFASISVKKIIENSYRLDASAYDFEALMAIKRVTDCKDGYVYLWSQNGFVEDSFIGPRMKRNYVSKNENAIGFLGSAEMLEVNPKPVKFLPKEFSNYYGVKDNEILISRSGTIGNTTFVTKSLSKFCVSEDAIRVVCKKDAGYIYTFLHSETGKTILRSFTFGAVIDHIEPEHLKKIPIPNTTPNKKEKINSLIKSSFYKRDNSNELIESAQQILYSELKIRNYDDIQPEYYDKTAGFRNYTVNAKDLDFRFDASYHLPEVTQIINILKKNSLEILKLSDERLTKSVFVGNRFKRVYVEKGNGVVYLNGKSITQLDPNGCNKLYLSFAKHEKQIKEQLEIRENMILVSCSGTLGRTVLVPKHWNGWAGTHDLIRIIPANIEIAGYLYCFLNSPIGNKIILRNTYGAVIDHIEPEHLLSIPIPILKDEKMKEINSLILQANQLRYEAYLEEKEALDIMNKEILGI